MKSQVMAVLMAQVLVFGCIVAQASQARSADLLTQALNQSLQERASLQKTYKENKKAAQAEERSNLRPAESPIAIEVGDDLGSAQARAQARATRPCMPIAATSGWSAKTSPDWIKSSKRSIAPLNPLAPASTSEAGLNSSVPLREPAVLL